MPTNEPWLDIAYRPRRTGKGQWLQWFPLPHAKYTVGEARALVDAGDADMATRHEADRVVACIKLRQKRQLDRRPYFAT